MDTENKYEEYYKYAEKLHDEQKARYTRLDQKASIYLTALSALIGAAGFFSNWMIEILLPLSSIVEYTILITIIVLLGSLVFSWICIMRLLRMGAVANLPLTKESDALFRDDHSYVTRLNVLIQTAIKCQNDNLLLNDKKVKYLTFAYRGMWVSLVITISLIVTTPFFNQQQSVLTTGEPIVTEKNNETNQAPENKPSTSEKPAEPDTTVKPLTPQYISEGYDPAIGSKTAVNDQSKKKE